MITIKNFRKKIRPVILERGKEYLESGKVGTITQTDSGECHAKVNGTHRYNVDIKFDGGGNITQANCNCPYEYGGYCKHIAAVLLALESDPPKSMLALSSEETRFLIAEYKSLAEGEHNSDTSTIANTRLIPSLCLSPYSKKLDFFLMIGREKMYKVHDVKRLLYNFQNEQYVEYGKYFAFTHRVEDLDERSVKLLEITRSALAGESRRYYDGSNTVSLDYFTIDAFFELYRDEHITLNDNKYFVKFDDPQIKFLIKPNGEKRFCITANTKYKLLGKGRRSYFLDERSGIILCASPKFSQEVYLLYENVCAQKELFVSEADMPEFYTAVLKRVSDHTAIKGLELIEEFIPPEMTAQLYVDCDEDNTIYADLMFNYADKVYHAFACPDAPHYDELGESFVKSAVLRYFVVKPESSHRSLMIAGDDTAYEFITSGLSELSKTMELYVSDKFRRMAVRPPVKPRIGVRVSGGLLELDISDDNYSNEELIEILKAYRAGVKYHRLKNGSFAVIDDSLTQFGELADNLDIKDKDLLKSKIKLPAYRMLYLDSLQNRENIRMRYSGEFKKTINEYRSKIENGEGMSVPDELSDIMRDYQKYGFRWLKTIAAYRFGGILADDMGLGKTLQAISMILDAKKNSPKIRPALIVCPSSLMLNWEAETARFAPQLKTLVVIGTSAVREKLIEDIHSEKYDAVITSYALLTRDIDKYIDLRFGLHFIDEAQYIKNHTTQAAKAVKAINSQVRFALTGTPIENSLAELWSVFDFIMPGYLFGYTRFKATFETPISGSDSRALKALQNNVTPFILRRLKKDVLDELPNKTETVLTVSMEGEQRKLYAANVLNLKKSINSGLGKNQKERVKILAALTILREVCCDPALVYENFKGKSAKLEQCAELVESCVNSGHKILLFSQFTSMLDIISRRLDKMGISFYTLKGSTRAKDRIRMVNEFNENDVKVFLISLKAGGTGLNLTGADIVIHYDPWWNASAENQASDRVYRIGQKNNVQVYKLITRNSIEEKILKLQQSKSELSSLIYGETSDITRMSADEILELLK